MLQTYPTPATEKHNEKFHSKTETTTIQLSAIQIGLPNPTWRSQIQVQ